MGVCVYIYTHIYIYIIGISQESGRLPIDIPIFPLSQQSGSSLINGNHSHHSAIAPWNHGIAKSHPFKKMAVEIPCRIYNCHFLRKAWWYHLDVGDPLRRFQVLAGLLSLLMLMGASACRVIHHIDRH